MFTFFQRQGFFFKKNISLIVLFSFLKKQLKKYIVINPQWLANAMASLISTKSIFISNQKGILDHQHLRTVWKEYSPNLHKLLLDLMEKFYVAIPISEVKSNIYEGQSVIPALLSDIQPPDILASWDVRDNRLKRFYQFNDLLPVDLFSRLAGSILLGMGIRRTRFWKDGMMIFEEDSKSLILVCSKEKGLLLCFSGKEWFNLFRKVKIILEMLLNKWEHLRITKYVVCPTCCQFNPLTEWHYCFEWKECYQAFYQEETLLLCEKAKKSDKIVNLIPELVRSEIPKTQKNKIILFEKIGEGSFAQVYKGEYKKEEVAVKQMKPGIIQDEEEALRRFFQEMELLHNEDHPNLLNVKAMVLSPLWLILPFAKYGSLYDYLHILRGQWKWPLPLRIAFDVACGINYLHNLDLPIIHCDLRSPNILLFSINYTDSVVAKVGDFGMSQYSLGRILLKDKKRTNPSTFYFKKEKFYFLHFFFYKLKIGLLPK